MLKNISKSELELLLIEGAKNLAVCLNCRNQTSGIRCESCIGGTFRGTTNLNEACRKCECNGHGDACDPVSGEKCNCQNNTESDNTCPAKLDKNSINYHCWLSQCSKCKESYSGHPKNGHQCFKHITIDSKMCLENAKSLDECTVEYVPLRTGSTIFFVLQPRFMNVDIKIVIDVTIGELDFFMSTNDDSFVVLTNQSNGFHEILLDSKYQWYSYNSDNSDYTENLNITPLVTSSKKSFENVSIPHGFIDDRGSDCRSNGKFYVLDKNAQSLTTFVKLGRCNTLLRVFELKNR
jgi:multipile epidermal growth factor-like domains protein 8